MKKIFIFIFLLFSIIFFSSCHDEGLSGIIDKSDIIKKTKTVVTDDQTTKIASASSTSQEQENEKTLSLKEMMRNDPNLREIIQTLNKVSGIVPIPDF
ncbi:hypothetical protein [Blattabacterium cuenoti]|uniref:hypothetical protein n=1 Tax=Blattabacterium cuenoti TaxID=1653831 RepID=UPI00163B97DA|nr:hypothetical protein [Blattabacterium cuenoti]